MRFERVNEEKRESGRAFLNRRRSPRANVSLPASIVTMSEYQYFELLDLSAMGARLRGQARPPLGKTALLRLNGFQTLCRVVWAADELCGVRFDELIPPRILARLNETGKPAELEFLEHSEI